jgi:hypothetical protein
MALVDFLMSFLAARYQLPLPPVVAAGILFQLFIFLRDAHAGNQTTAQCLYVLTDDNLPAIVEFRSNAAYTSCLLSIVRPSAGDQTVNLHNDSFVRLSVLACGRFNFRTPFPLLMIYRNST